MSQNNWNIGKVVRILLVAAYGVMWFGGIGHYIIAGKPPLDAPWAASVFLLLAGLLISVTSPLKEQAGLWVAAAIGLSAEIIGVHAGFIFSEYQYTDVLLPQIFNVPVVMLSAWMVLISYSRQLLMKFKLSFWVESSIAALWMTAIDLVIDPLAANQLGYWKWAETGWYYGVPFHNFAGWFAVSLIIFFVVRQRWKTNITGLYVGLSIVIFFTSIAFSCSLYLAGTIGLLLCLVHLRIHPIRIPSKTGKTSHQKRNDHEAESLTGINQWS